MQWCPLGLFEKKEGCYGLLCLYYLKDMLCLKPVDSVVIRVKSAVVLS
jgi:hypothetical protein